jgi:hypothetical protein
VTENLNDVLSAKLLMEEELLEKNKSLQTQLREVCITLLSFTNVFLFCVMPLKFSVFICCQISYYKCPSFATEHLIIVGSPALDVAKG